MPQDKSPKAYRKPLPHIDEESRPWWEAAQRHELYLQKCRDCGDLRFHPRTLCTNCLSSRTEWVRCKGTGKIYTFTVTNQNQAAGFRDELPYVMAWVEVDEGLAQLQQELRARGLAATLAQRTLLVPLGGDDTYDVVRDAVADLALPLCRLEQRRHQVEELFRDEEEEVPHA